ncbi:MAG: hypothetical protein AMXMBFR46_16020 [Acidimicrobiia bacterium]
MKTWTRKSRLRQYVDAAAWPIPAAYLLAAVVLGIGIPRLDRALGDTVPAEFGVGAAQALLTAFATGLITVMGFIITVVIAGTTFSGTAVTPRIVREQRRNPKIHHIFGLLLFSVVYAFLVLNRVAPPDNPEYVPDLAVWLIVPLLVLDVLGLLVLVREMGHALRLVEIIDKVHHRGAQVIERMFPDELGTDGDDPPIEGTTEAPAQTIRNSTTSGVVASLDIEDLVAEAQRVDTTFALACPIGSYRPLGAPLVHVADHRPDLDEQRVQRAITLDDERTIDQDPLYALRLLVDIAARALSPAVNDPSTAVQALDRIEALLRLLATRDLDAGALRDASGHLRLVVPLPRWEDYVSVSLTEIRQYGASSTQVARRLRALLGDLLHDVPPSRRPALQDQLELLDQAIDSHYADPAERAAAMVPDRHGLGGPTPANEAHPSAG